MRYSAFVGKQTRDAAERGRAHHSEHDPGPDGAAAAQQPAHKIELEQAHQPPVDAADDHENQTDFIKGLHKKTLPFSWNSISGERRVYAF